MIQTSIWDIHIQYKYTCAHDNGDPENNPHLLQCHSPKDYLSQFLETNNCQT